MNKKTKVLCYIFRHVNNGIVQRMCLKKICQLEGGEAYSKTARQLFKESYGIQIGYGTYGGIWTNGSLRYRDFCIGNYCSIAQNIYIYTDNHPLDKFSTHPFLYCKSHGADEEISYSHPLTIGNDVWIGQNVIILPSCHNIGNGAVIGAGAIVTKDVEPYTINVGNPSKAIRKRFPDEIIKKLEESRWWDMELDELKKNMDSLQQLIKGE